MLALIIILVVVVLVGLYAIVQLQRARLAAEPHRERLGADRRAAQAALRPHPQPGRDREGLRVPRARDARRRHRGPQRRHERQGPHDQAEAENLITGALKSLFALSEAYPDLKANQNFAQLQEELTGTEGRIAYARQFYNDTVYRYNTKIQSFPANVLAGMFSFSEREYFEADDESRGPTQVQF